MKTVLLYSGGMDSTVLLYFLKHINDEVHALSFNYGQRHKREIQSAIKITTQTNTPHKIIDISNIRELLHGSSLTSEIPTPHGHYQDENMKLTVVPNRNMILLSMAIGYAVSIKAPQVAYAAHSGDHAIYPDCRPLFFKKMNEISQIANYEPIEIYAPFLNLTKGQIAKIGKKLKAPLKDTWTCYEGTILPCGQCGACVERAEALKEAEQ